MEESADLFDVQHLIGAAETEDEIGTVLRMHLAIDQLLKVYLTSRVTESLKPYITIPTYTGQKLSFAAAFGMPLPFLRATHEVNGIRNGLAHKHKQLTKDKVAQLARQVDLIKEIDESFVPLAKRYVELPAARPGERYVFGDGNLRLDFLIASVSLLSAASQWLVAQLGATRV